jgi:hypothetical protein
MTQGGVNRITSWSKLQSCAPSKRGSDAKFPNGGSPHSFNTHIPYTTIRLAP